MPPILVPLEWFLIFGNVCSLLACAGLFALCLRANKQIKEQAAAYEILHREHVIVMVQCEKQSARLDALENGTFVMQLRNAFDEVLARAEGYKAQRDRIQKEFVDYRNEHEGNGGAAPAPIF